MTYTSSASGLTLETAQFAGGVIRLSGTSQEINYLLTDHLGSVRAIVTPTGTVRERNDYYAFGARHVRADHPQNANRFKFNGKELQTTGFASSDPAPFLDYGARMYNPRLGRWFNPDPLAESYFAHSPYHFSGNNPANLIDQNGMWYDGYMVDDWGNFTQVNTMGGDQFDVIYSGIDGWLEALMDLYLPSNDHTTSSSIRISPEFMDSHKRYKYELIDAEWNPYDIVTTDYYKMTDAGEAKGLFEFLSNNTKIEWLNTYFEMNDGTTLNTITTSHEKGTVFSDKMREDMFNGAANFILRSDHNHFDGINISGGDNGVLKAIQTEYNSPNVQTNIYFNKKYYPYKYQKP